MNLYVKFYGDFSKINTTVSVIASLLVVAMGSPFAPFNTILSIALHVLPATYVSAGFLLSLYIFNTFRYNEFYFYYNKNISRAQLIRFTCIINIILFIAAMIIIKKYFA